jgi:oligopeptide/dipeptide ABC transporter ATP-binding protein
LHDFGRQQSGTKPPFLIVRDLKKYFGEMRHILRTPKNALRAVDGMSFTIQKGETLGLIGESGCGKSTTARLILRLIEPTAGDVIFDGVCVFDASREEMHRLRRRMQIVFQDPFSSLNPRLTVEEIIGEGMEVHDLARGREKHERVASLLKKVGLDAEQMGRYPHELSGGQRQRVGIARALAVEPEFIILDEPIASLDVSIQAQVLNLLADLQEEFHLTYLFITHDLRIVEQFCDRVAVMYLGRIVELTGVDAFFSEPLHPYSQALLSAVPVPDPDKRSTRIILSGEQPDAAHPPQGCSFHPRCPKKFEPCAEQEPHLQEARPQHEISCHLFTAGLLGCADSSVSNS